MALKKTVYLKQQNCCKPVQGTQKLKKKSFFRLHTLINGAMAQRLELATDNRVVVGSNPAGAAWKLWQFPLPHFASVFRMRHYKPTFYLGSMPGEVKYPIQ